MSGSLDASIERRSDGGWRIRVPLRREDIQVTKQTYVTEEVEIRREYAEEPDAPGQRIRKPAQPPR
jgi:stress response protein YsnF